MAALMAWIKDILVLSVMVSSAVLLAQAFTVYSSDGSALAGSLRGSPRHPLPRLIGRKHFTGVLRLRGGSERKADMHARGGELSGYHCTDEEGPSQFRDFEVPENAATPEDFIHASQARDQEMGHEEFLRYSQTMGQDGASPEAQEWEELLRKLEADEHERRKTMPQVCRCVCSYQGALSVFGLDLPADAVV